MGSASEVLVLDIDPHNGGDDSLARLLAANGPLPSTAESAIELVNHNR